VLAELDNIRCDLSRFHRVDDMESMSADRFWCFAERLSYYDGVVAASIRRQLAERPPESEPASGAPMDPSAPIAAPDQLDALHAHPVYGDIPGLPPVFSHSTAPLAPQGGDP
jgi:hypothetical protein